VESVDDTPEYWKRERITYNAAYGNERILANLFLPKNASPPYQTIVYFPHAGALEARSSENMEMVFLDFIIRSGRAVLLPVYQGTYERHLDEGTEGTNNWRDLTIQRTKDFSALSIIWSRVPTLIMSGSAFTGSARVPPPHPDCWP